MPDHASADSAPAARGYVQLVRENADYRRLWLGQVSSLLGDWFNLIATVTLITSLTGSGLAVGLLFAARMIAPFLASPVAGVLADRLPRRTILIATDLARAVIVLGFLLVDSPDRVWLLYVLTFAQLFVSGFFYPARNAILPDLVERADIGTATALGAATWSVMLALGAALGGVVAGQLGTTPCFLIDAITFLVSAAVVARITVRGGHGMSGSPSGTFNAFASGLGYLRRNPDVMATACHKASSALIVSGPFAVAQAALTERDFVIGEGGSTGLGMMYACVGVGTGVAPLVARRITGDHVPSMRRALTYSYLMAGAGMCIVAYGTVFPVVLAGSFLRGAGAGLNWVFATQLLMMYVPTTVRGRVFSVEFGLLTLASAIGSAVGGYVLDWLGGDIRTMLVALSILLVIPSAAWTLWRRRVPPGESPGS